MSSHFDGLALKFWQNSKKTLPISQTGQTAQGHKGADRFQNTCTLSIMLLGVDFKMRDYMSIRGYWAQFGAEGNRTDGGQTNNKTNNFSINMTLLQLTSASCIFLDDLASLVIDMIQLSISCRVSAYVQFMSAWKPESPSTCDFRINVQTRKNSAFRKDHRAFPRSKLFCSQTNAAHNITSHAACGKLQPRRQRVRYIRTRA